MEKLRNISPYFLADKIIAPVLLYHYENDMVIGYAQSVKFVEKMKKLGKKICFVKGKGFHGFATPSDEEKAYFHIVDFFREGIKDAK